MPTDRELIKLQQMGELGSVVANPTTAVTALHRKMVSFFAINSVAGTAITETNMSARIPHAYKIISVQVAAPIAVTADNTNYATITVSKRTGAGGATTMWAQNTQITGLGNMTAFVPYALTQLSTSELAANDSLTVAISKAGTGVALSAATSHVVVTVEYEEV